MQFHKIVYKMKGAAVISDNNDGGVRRVNDLDKKKGVVRLVLKIV